MKRTFQQLLVLLFLYPTISFAQEKELSYDRLNKFLATEKMDSTTMVYSKRLFIKTKSNQDSIIGYSVLTETYELDSQIYLITNTELNLKLQKELIETENESTIFLFLMMFLSVILLFILIFYLRQKSVNKKKYTEIIERVSTEENESIKVAQTNLDNLSRLKIGIPQNQVKDIALSLRKFEKSNNFTRKAYDLNLLAKELKTNSKYLSKFINAAKGLNFTQYINSLRIDYAIKKITEDKKFRYYTIKGIAESCGFSRVEPFNRAFFKKTGISTSYFIKQIDK